MTGDRLTQAQLYAVVCLEHQDTRLYAELIQIIEQRQRCWVRPLVLTLPASDRAAPTTTSNQEGDRSICYDLRQGSDLLWPLDGFRMALDAEVLPLLTHLSARQSSAEITSVARQQFEQFIRQVWQARSSSAD